MQTVRYTYWQDGEFYVGFLNYYPYYHTQSTSNDELVENLRDLLQDLGSGEVPFIRKTEELQVA